MNLTEMKAVLRRDLRDEDAGNYRWSDDELGRHIARAVREFSEQVPLEQKTTKATAAGSRELDISTVSDRVMVAAVEYPAGRFPPFFQQFSLWGDTLTLLGDEVPDGSDAVIYYGKLHTLDGEGSTIPSYLDDLVATGAAGYAAVAWAVYAVNRVNVGGGGTPEDLLAWGQRKLDYFLKELKRLGRRHRVRVSSLYNPYRAVVSKLTDGGP